MVVLRKESHYLLGSHAEVPVDGITGYLGLLQNNKGDVVDGAIHKDNYP